MAILFHSLDSRPRECHAICVDDYRIVHGLEQEHCIRRIGRCEKVTDNLQKA